jgi:hypothetical protein
LCYVVLIAISPGCIITLCRLHSLSLLSHQHLSSAGVERGTINAIYVTDFRNHGADCLTYFWNPPSRTITDAAAESIHLGAMARDDARKFKDLRNSLYTDLVAYACIPEVEIDGVVTQQLERRFFPAGTAEKVLTFDALERLLTLVTPARSRPVQLAKQVEIRKLHVFLAVLITSKCDIEALVSFTETLLVPQTWTDALVELVKLPTEHVGNLRNILGDDPTADIFFQKQHDFFAPIIEKNKEISGQFRRVPYVREKLIGQGSFGRIYEVVVRLKYSSTIEPTEIGATAAWCLPLIHR